MNLLIDGCDDDILFFTDGTWLYRHEFRGLYEGVSPDKLAEMVFIVVTPFHDGYDDFVAATESLVCL
ncbi:TPA: hypothetical protein G9F27_004969 [Salmonella enterica]|uniref:Uncharacterized protein n=1 Tax=Salmonella enterica TaxID=28901 RepID=A0A743SQ77_SALER|nr:hypothetical protein [Salmonella enterica]